MHRDVKPSNLLVNNVLRVAVFFFGAAPIGEPRRVVGTRAYLPPEVLEHWKPNKVRLLPAWGPE